ncbi:hypothetical protein BDA96_03G298800 [Sorghum bicolor]|uniref:Uncharacterized protein n=2 Tax=Sorghum bicolor TaxID=4558 RepID=A0A921RG10_SORBI|nr:hypothetical protein BDA96_03G298800 [Sorghum bicolor]OQU87423.1 hypothetical protein SORBI_3003G276750 [Sorghum bicolor]
MEGPEEHSKCLTQSESREENSPQLPATHCHSCEADKAKARIKKLIAEEATERWVGTCTVASGFSCSTIYGKKARMSAPQQRCASLLCQRLSAGLPFTAALFKRASPSPDADGSLSKKLRLVGLAMATPAKIAGAILWIDLAESAPRLFSFYLYNSSCYLVGMNQTQVLMLTS